MDFMLFQLVQRINYLGKPLLFSLLLFNDLENGSEVDVDPPAHREPKDGLVWHDAESCLLNPPFQYLWNLLSNLCLAIYRFLLQGLSQLVVLIEKFHILL
jgi:hypothetical protein